MDRGGPTELYSQLEVLTLDVDTMMIDTAFKVKNSNRVTTF